MEPDKIYIQPNAHDRWFDGNKPNDNFVEYVRKDALVPDNLDEAAEDFVWEVMENDEEGISELSKKLRPTSKISDYYDALGEFFKAGAEWMTKQGVSTVAISSTEDGITEEGMKLISDYLESLPDKTEVVLQIRKKQ